MLRNVPSHTECKNSIFTQFHFYKTPCHKAVPSKQSMTVMPQYHSYDDVSILIHNDELAWSVNTLVLLYNEIGFGHINEHKWYTYKVLDICDIASNESYFYDIRWTTYTLCHDFTMSIIVCNLTHFKWMNASVCNCTLHCILVTVKFIMGY